MGLSYHVRIHREYQNSLFSFTHKMNQVSSFLLFAVLQPHANKSFSFRLVSKTDIYEMDLFMKELT